MGVWTWAEMSIGILVCCLPVVPKFVSFVSPKIQTMLSSMRKSRSSNDSGTYVLRNSNGRSDRAKFAKLGYTEHKTRPEVLHQHTDSQIHLKDELLRCVSEDIVTETWQGQAFPDNDRGTRMATKRDKLEDRPQNE